jgi:uncharacterized protein with HEPN domain
MPRALLPRRNDILRGINFVETALQGKVAADIETDMMLRFSIERAIEIISEAVRHIPAEVQADFPLVPWRNIRAIGNKLRHEYDRLDADIIWDVATHHLSGLRTVIEAIKAKQP